MFLEMSKWYTAKELWLWLNPKYKSFVKDCLFTIKNQEY